MLTGEVRYADRRSLANGLIYGAGARFISHLFLDADGKQARPPLMNRQYHEGEVPVVYSARKIWIDETELRWKTSIH
jgi:hypothetical protein